DRDLGASNLFAELMQPGVVAFGHAVFLVHLEAGEWNRPGLVRDIDQPEERRRRGAGEADDIFVGNQHDAAAAQQERYRKRGMRRPGKWRAPIQAGDEFWLGHVIDVENDEAAVPVADVKAISNAHGMMAAMVGALPGGCLAAGGPLPRHPPATDFFGPLRFLKVDNRHDVAEIAVELRRAIDVAAVEREPMHSSGRP